MALSKKEINRIAKKVEENLHSFQEFHTSVEAFFLLNPLLKVDPPIIHSVKGRLKNIENLKKKIKRKSEKNITYENVFETLTDIAGIRVLHLHQSQFPIIHKCIMEQVSKRLWALYEKPKAYTWDPGSVDFFAKLGLESTARESLYTSVHYVVKPREDSFITCEIQVRTLFEEVWGEIEHQVNYPEKTSNKSAREQIGVLARLVGAGTRLADSIFETAEEHKIASQKPRARKKATAKKKHRRR